MIIEVIYYDSVKNKQNTFSLIDDNGSSLNYFKLFYEDKNLKKIERVVTVNNVISDTVPIDISEFIKCAIPMEALNDIVTLWKQYAVEKWHLNSTGGESGIKKMG